MEKEMDFTRLDPYMEQIQSETLREAVRQVWEGLFQKSCWEKLEDVPCSLEPTAISLVQHTCNVTDYAIHAAKVYDQGYEELTIHMDYLIAGCLLHDVSRIVEYEPAMGKTRVSDEGQIYVEQFLGVSAALGANLPTEVVHMVVANTPKTNLAPATPEALILYFCERIDMDVRNKLAGLSLRAKDKNYLIMHKD